MGLQYDSSKLMFGCDFIHLIGANKFSREFSFVYISLISVANKCNDTIV